MLYFIKYIDEYEIRLKKTCSEISNGFLLFFMDFMFSFLLNKCGEKQQDQNLIFDL